MRRVLEDGTVTACSTRPPGPDIDAEDTRPTHVTDLGPGSDPTTARPTQLDDLHPEFDSAPDTIPAPPGELSEVPVTSLQETFDQAVAPRILTPRDTIPSPPPPPLHVDDPSGPDD